MNEFIQQSHSSVTTPTHAVAAAGDGHPQHPIVMVSYSNPNSNIYVHFSYISCNTFPGKGTVCVRIFVLLCLIELVFYIIEEYILQ